MPPSSSRYRALVEEEHLLAAVLGGLGLRQQARRVVAAGLRRARAALAGARVLRREPDRHGLHAAVEVGAGRARDDVVGDLLRGAHPEERLFREHERAQVEARLGRLRHPVGVDRDELLERLDEDLARQLGQREARGPSAACARRSRRAGTSRSSRRRDGRPSCPRRSPARSAAPRPTARADRAVGRDARTVPAALLRPADVDHVVGEVVAEAGVGEDRVALGARLRLLVAGDLPDETGWRRGLEGRLVVMVSSFVRGVGQCAPMRAAIASPTSEVDACGCRRVRRCRR